VTESDRDAVITERLLVRPPREADRERFVELFMSVEFMVFYGRARTVAEASRRFDRMTEVCRTVPFGKQPVVERSSGRVVGYTGAGYIEYAGRTWLEWGWRLVPECRGRGYATEATRALLAKARRSHPDDLLVIIVPENLPSQNVARKLGCEFWKQDRVEGYLCNLYLLPAEASAGAPVEAPAGGPIW
jgi:RimJ/RimL family protein N-acetyltransferase